MPKLDVLPYHGRIPKGEKLKRMVERLLENRQKQPADAVIAVTDVYTGGLSPDFADANVAKAQMREWVGVNPRFHPHAAQHDFEAWLLPYWNDIQRLAGSNQSSPGSRPEQVNHTRPPAHHLKDVFRTGRRRRAYIKTRDANRILQGNDLLVSAQACPELKSLLNTILRLCGGNPIP